MESAKIRPEQQTQTEATPTANYWPALAVMGLAVILFFGRLGARALWASEFRWGEIAREMLLTHNYFWPTINGHVYYDKPLGSYWLVIAATWLTGSLNEAATRIPSAIAGLLSVGILMVLARRLYDRGTAVWAGLILTTSFSFVFFSRTACADIETIAGELAVLWLFLRNEESSGGWWVVAMWLLMAVTSLTKGLLGFALPLVVIGPYCCLAHGWRELWQRLSSGAWSDRLRWFINRNRWFFNPYSLLAIPLGAAVYFAPFVISEHVMGSDKGLAMVYRENLVRFFHPFDHRGPVYLYVYIIFALMAPWCAVLPASLVQMHHNRHLNIEPTRSDRFSLVFFWATFIFFTLSGSRRSYYLLPILPAAALIVARLAETPAERFSALSRWLAKAGMMVAVGALLLSVLIFRPPSSLLPPPQRFLPPAPDRMVLGAAWIISVAAFLYAYRRGFNLPRAMAALGITAALVLGYVYLFAMPAAEAYRGEKPFALEVRRELGPKTSQLVLYKTQGPLFYLDLPKPLPEYKNRWQLRRAVRKDHIRWIIVQGVNLQDIPRPFKIVAREATFRFETHWHKLNKVMLVELSNQAGKKPIRARPNS